MRKGWVAALVFLMFIATACTGGGGKPADPSAPPDTSQNNTAGEKTFSGAWPYQVPPKGHFNTFVTDGMVYGGPYLDLVQQPLAMFKWADNSYIPVLATAWEVKGDSLEVKLRSGVKWSDGSEFSADDVVTTYTIYRMLKDAIWKYVDKVEATDKQTVVFHMARPSTVVTRYALRYPIRPHSTYGEWARKVSDAAATDPTFESDAAKQLRLDFEKFRPQEMVASGAFKIDPSSITEAQLTLVKVPTAWNAGTVQFDKLILYNGETPTVTPLVLGKRADYATHGFPPATEKEFESKGIRIIRPPTYTGPALFFNFNNEAFQKTEVRQAIAHIIDRTENGTVALGKSGVAVQQMTGFSDNVVPNWLSPEDVKKLNTYPHDLKKAEELLTKVGFKKGSDGIWMTDKGAKMEYEVMVPAEYADWSAAAENAAQQLTQFGIKTTVRGVTFAQVPVDVDAGKFQIAVQPWGAAHPHPHFAYVNNLFLHNYVQANGPGMNFQMKQKTAGGDIDFQELVVGSADGLDQAKQKAAVTKVALAFNEMLPIIPLFERYGNNASLSDHVDGWPADSDPILKNGLYADNPIVVLIQTGVMKPK